MDRDGSEDINAIVERAQLNGSTLLAEGGRPSQKNIDGFSRTYLREMAAGVRGCVVGYERVRKGYQGKLIAMGLLPGTQFQILSPWGKGGQVKLSVNGLAISLCQPEADALVVEEIDLSVVN